MNARGAPPDSHATAPERKSDPTERTRDLAKAVLAASGNDARLSTLNESMAQSWLVALQKALPNAKPEWRPAMEAVINDELHDWNDKITKINIEIYASKFTDAQLLDMLVFYRTEGGRALVAQTPTIIREKTEVGRKLAAETLPKLVAATCAKVGCPEPSPAAMKP